MPAREKRRKLLCLISRITLKHDGLEIGIRTTHLAEFLRNGDQFTASHPTKLIDEPVVVMKINA